MLKKSYRPLIPIVLVGVVWANTDEQVSCPDQWRAECQFIQADEPAQRSPLPQTPAPVPAVAVLSTSAATMHTIFVQGRAGNR